MDASLISAAASALVAAKDIGATAIGLRDVRQMADEVRKLNAELLKAQDALFVHGARLLELQEQHSLVREELKKAEQVLQERTRYKLFEVGDGMFAYRFNPGSDFTGGTAQDEEPLHYLCQPCFDQGRKMILQLFLRAADGPVACCPHCKDFFSCSILANKRGR